MTLKRGFKTLVDEAMQKIEVVSVDEARKLIDDPGIVFVDIRESGELKREGTIPGAVHAPRGMLEFWVDPDSPYHKPALAPGKKMVLFCQSAWRSALATATLADMGLADVRHLDGGFSAWKDAGGPIAEKPRKG